MSRRLLGWAVSVTVVAAVVVAVVAIIVRSPEGGPGIEEDPFRRLAEENAAVSPDQRPQIEVLNGCGVSGIAARAQDFLRERGYDVVNVENARDFRYEESLVIDRGGDIRVARALGRDLGTSNIIRQVRPDLVLQATVILGNDYRTLAPYREPPPDE